MLNAIHYGPVTRFDLARTIGGRGRYWTSAYLLDGVLIDSGPPHAAPELVEYLRDKPLTAILNTHSHEDHIGANGLLQSNRQGLAIRAHPLALPVLADPSGEQPLQFYRRVIWGWPEPSLGCPLADGELIETVQHCLRVLYTPGHSRDHLCLYEEQRGWLFSGDLYVGGRDRGLRLDTDIWGVITSLKEVSKLDLNRLFPGSASVKDEPQQALSRKIYYLESTGQRVLELHRRGWEVGAIARELFGGPMFIEGFTWGHFSRRNLVLSYIEGQAAV
jgi:glyoxylase-like metal-dependent hydrolase (beta-lactamase superfamily II)